MKVQISGRHCSTDFCVYVYIIKEFVQPKMSLNKGISYLEREREGVRERERCGLTGQQAGIFKVRLGL